MRIDFRGSPEPTLGVEWELALVDRETRDLRNEAARLFTAAHPRMPDPSRLHKELLRNTVEAVSGVCRTVEEAMTDLRGTLEMLRNFSHGRIAPEDPRSGRRRGQQGRW